MNGWIAVDLDGVLAEYHGWQGEHHIGPPVPAMIERVKGWLADGLDVRIFTARVCIRSDSPPDKIRFVVETIDRWCQEHIGQVLPVTNIKDYGMVELWDDRAITVEPNTGKIICHPKGDRKSVV